MTLRFKPLFQPNRVFMKRVHDSIEAIPCSRFSLLVSLIA
jgi:hypothetical protein